MRAQSSIIVPLVQLALIVGVMYVLFIMPQSKARKKTEAMLAALKKGDEVMTAGGVVGKVRDIRESMITVESASSTLVIDRSRIVRVGNQTSTTNPGT